MSTPPQACTCVLGWTSYFKSYFALILITVIYMNILLLCFTHCSLSHDSNRNTTLEKVSKIWRKCYFQYACWGIKSKARNILGAVTYMPGPPRRSLSQYKVRCGPFRLMSPYQRRGTIHPKVTIWKKEGIEEHSHGVWWTALYTLTQVLQILHIITHKPTNYPHICWLAASLCVVGVLAHSGCHHIIQVDAAHWWWMRRYPLTMKSALTA